MACDGDTGCCPLQKRQLREEEVPSCATRTSELTAAVSTLFCSVLTGAARFFLCSTYHGCDFCHGANFPRLWWCRQRAIMFSFKPKGAQDSKEKESHTPFNPQRASDPPSLLSPSLLSPDCGRGAPPNQVPCGQRHWSGAPVSPEPRGHIKATQEVAETPYRSGYNVFMSFPKCRSGLLFHPSSAPTALGAPTITTRTVWIRRLRCSHPKDACLHISGGAGAKRNM